jgi:2-dehydropantoate 2-reductase
MSNPQKLQVAIVGAGTIGCYFGGRLSGHAHVSMVGRPRIAKQIAENGLAVSDLNGFFRHLNAEDVAFGTDMSVAADADLVLVAVKSGATAEVAHELGRALSRPRLIVSLQNGLHNADVLRQHLPTHVVLAGMVPFNVVQAAGASFHQGSSGRVMVQEDARLTQFLGVFEAAGVALNLRTDMPAVQRAKLLLNLNNAINALSGVPLREELARRDWRQCLALAQREALRIFRVARLPVARLTPIAPNWMPTLLDLPDRWFRLFASRTLAIDPLARSSTWDDLQAGRRTEVDAIQGEVLALAAAHGLRAPVNSRLQQLIRDAEQKLFSMTGAGLLAELKTAARSQPPA